MVIEPILLRAEFVSQSKRFDNIFSGGGGSSLPEKLGAGNRIELDLC